jgi:misacylated tRNA(Ala) deacylase
MTRLLFRDDPYLRDAPATVVAITPEGGIRLDASLFYPTGGGQPGDSGWIDWAGERIAIATAVKDGDDVVLIPAEPAALPEPGTAVGQHLDWGRRLGHMRVHTALHLLSVVLPFAVTGGAIGADRGRLDFDMAEAPVAEEVTAALSALIAADLPVTEEWITEAELDANPGLVKTLTVKPPRGAGRVRLVRIGQGEGTVDLQPCGGTHVARTGEIGAVALGRIEKKGRMNRRVSLLLEPGR